MTEASAPFHRESRVGIFATDNIIGESHDEYHNIQSHRR